MQYSNFQNEIFNFVANETSKSLTINAVAGSGKTFTSLEAIKRLPKHISILGLAFNNSIAKEWQGKVEGHSNIFAKTLHSHGFKTFQRAKIRTKLDNNKWSNYVRENELSSIISREDREFYPFCKNVCNILALCRENLIKYGDTESIEAIVERHGFETMADEIEVVNNLLNLVYELPKGNNIVIDFCDMITLPIMCKTLTKYIEKYDVVLVDEAQDLSKAKQELMLKSIAKGGRFIAVGDPRQAINGFCGAMNDSFSRLEELADQTLPLSVNYRCGKAMIKLAQEIVPQITAHDDAIEGNVETIKDLKKANKGDLVICRKSAPLISLCLRFWANGKSAYVKGNDLCEALKNLIKKSKATDTIELFDYLDSELEKIKKNLLKKGIASEAIDSCPSVVVMEDKIKCLQTLTERCTTIREVESLLEKVFEEVKGGNAISLCTIHKAKGLESDNVFIILPNCLPMTWKGQQQWEYEQEMNLKYVALTRAKKNLYFIDLEQEELKSVEC